MRLRRTLPLALFTFALGAGSAACHGKSSLRSLTQQKLDPSDAKWKESELTIGKANAKFFMTGTGDKDPLYLNCYFESFPAGATVDVGSASTTIDDHGHGSLDVDMRPKVGALSLRSVANEKVDLDTKIVIKAAGSEKIEQKLPPLHIETAIAEALAKVRDGALKFEGEPADDGKVGSVAMVKVGSLSGIKVVGSADKVWDVDWVAVEEDRESQRVKSCDGYQKVKGNVDVTQVDSLVKIFDRRTGKKIAEQTFQPKDECPSFAMVSKDNKAKAYVIDTDIEPWVRDTLDKQK